MKHSESITKLAVALVAAQGELKAVGKDAVNPHFKNRYASLDSIIDTVRPVLARHNLAVVQGAGVPETNEHGQLVGFAVETMLIHSSGEWLSNAAVVPVVKSDAQGAGGALTYGRRYGLSALLALATEDDDDGNAASRTTAVKSANAVEPSRGQRAESTGGSESGLTTTPARQQPAAASQLDNPPCPECGGAMYDNRLSKTKPTQPDFKCKNYKSCKGVIWPPREPKPAVKSDDDAWAETVAATEAPDGLPF